MRERERVKRVRQCTLQTLRSSEKERRLEREKERKKGKESERKKERE